MGREGEEGHFRKRELEHKVRELCLRPGVEQPRVQYFWSARDNEREIWRPGGPDSGLPWKSC